MAAAALACAAPSFAADPNVLVDVRAVPTRVTFSRTTAVPPLPTFASYEVRITNKSNNTLNHVRFVGTTTVPPVSLPATRSAPLVESSIASRCTPPEPATTRVECAIGTLRGRGGAASFTLVFAAPAAGNGDRIRLDWTAFYGEGASDSSGASHQDSTVGVTNTDLGTPTATDVQSFVRAAGGTFFTGIDAVARSADLWTTTVRVPPSAATTAKVFEEEYRQSCSADLIGGCKLSTVTVPGTFGAGGENFLEVILRRDVLTIRTGAKIANAEIWHKPTCSPEPDPLTSLCDPQDPTGYVELRSCDLIGGKPTLAVPRCIKKRTEWTKKTAPSADYIGDWEFSLWVIENGRFRY